MDKPKQGLKRALIAVGLLAAWALITGGMDARDAEITARAERAAASKKADVSPADRVAIQLWVRP